KRKRKLLGRTIIAMTIAVIAVPLTLAGNVLWTLHNRSNVVFAQPGQPINSRTDYRLTYNLKLIKAWKESSPYTLNQIVIGIRGTNGSTGCIDIGVIQDDINNGDISGKKEIKFPAPQKPGVYYIHFGYTLEYGCNDAKSKWQDYPDLPMIGVVIVGSP